jgi:hypothetical protein
MFDYTVIETCDYRHSEALSLEHPNCESCGVRFTLDTEMLDICSYYLSPAPEFYWVKALCLTCGQKWADKHGLVIQFQDGEL